MFNFFACYLVIYYADLIQFIVYGRLFLFRAILKPGNFIISTFYIALLEILSFIAVSRFYFAKDFSGLIDLALIKTEIIATYIFIYIQRKFYLPIVTNISTIILLVLCITAFWGDLYIIILQYWNRKIGLDVNIRNIYIIRLIYTGTKRLTYILYITLFLFHIYSSAIQQTKRVLLLIIPVFILKVLESEEEEEENVFVKLVVILILLGTTLYFIYIPVLNSVINDNSEFQLLFYINSIHFFLATIFSFIDFLNYGKGLKEAMKVNRKKIKKL